MLSHIFKLIWKKKKSNFLIMLEIFVSFLILFAVWSLGVYTWRNYVTPAGLSTDRVWAVYLEFNTPSDSLARMNKELIDQRLKGVPEVRAWSFSSSNVPFGFSSSNRDIYYGDRHTVSDVMFVDPSYPEVMGVSVRQGRWFTAEDTIGGGTPVVITAHLARELFGTEDPLGKMVGEGEQARQKVVGVIDYFRHKSSFQPDENALFQPGGPWDYQLLVRVDPAADAEFEAQFARTLLQLDKAWTVEIQHMDNMKSTQNKTILIPILILAAVCGFLVFNVALGLFGVLFQNISRRKGEIGIRRAMGATKRQVLRYFIWETLVMTTFGVALGFFFAVQAPLLRLFDVEASVFLWGIALAALSIYLLTMICAFYPGRLAAGVYPAVALHEE